MRAAATVFSRYAYNVGHNMAHRQRGKPVALDHKVAFAIRQKCASLFTNEGCESRIDLAWATCFEN